VLKRHSTLIVEQRGTTFHRQAQVTTGARPGYATGADPIAAAPSAPKSMCR
jgi:hypothetical protein